MEKVDHSREGRIMNIKKNLYIDLYKQNKKVVDEQITTEDNHKKILFDVSMLYIDTPP
jgi:hypothetical protein